MCGDIVAAVLLEWTVRRVVFGMYSVLACPGDAWGACARWSERLNAWGPVCITWSPFA